MIPSFGQLLTEAMEQLFHATDHRSLIQILASEKIQLSFSDRLHDKTNFVLSTSREKYGGYARQHTEGAPVSLPVIIQLNGKNIENDRHYQMEPFDWFGRAVPGDKLKHLPPGEMTVNVNRFRDVYDHGESEERIYGDINYLPLTPKFVHSIHVYLDLTKAKRLPTYAQLVELAGQNSSIPIYFYPETRPGNHLANMFKNLRTSSATTADKLKNILPASGLGMKSNGAPSNDVQLLDGLYELAKYGKYDYKEYLSGEQKKILIDLLFGSLSSATILNSIKAVGHHDILMKIATVLKRNKVKTIGALISQMREYYIKKYPQESDLL